MAELLPALPCLGKQRQRLFQIPLAQALKDQLKFHGVEFLGFHQHLLADADLAEIVQQAGVADLPQLPLREEGLAVGSVGCAVDSLRESHRQVRHPARMARGHGITAFNGGHGSVDEAFDEQLDLLPQRRVLHRDARLAREALRQVLMFLLEGHHAPPLPFFPHAIDELQHAEDLALVVRHGHHQHALGVIDALPVEGVRKTVGRGLGYLVDVRDVQGLAGGRHETREGRGGDGHPEAVVGQIQGRVLGVGENQFLALVIHQVERPRLGPQQLAQRGHVVGRR